MKLFRVHHLLFGAAVIAAYFTAESTDIAHAWIGYGAATLIVLRLMLGFLRKSGFEFRRLRPILSAGALGQTGLRHPAIGRGLTVALLLAVAGTAGTGIAMDQGGTLIGQSVRLDREGTEHDEHEGGEREAGEREEEGALAEVHETLGNLILPLVAVHLAYMLLLRRDLAFFLLFMPKRRTTPKTRPSTV